MGKSEWFKEMNRFTVCAQGVLQVFKLDQRIRKTEIGKLSIYVWQEEKEKIGF